MSDVLVIGAGNAGLCAALSAREAGASVTLLEASPKAWRGGNTQHTRNIRCTHDESQDVLVGAYPEQEYWQDLVKVTGGKTSEALARLVIRTSATCRDWMRRHGVHFQDSLSGTLHLSRTNAFFMGGGKALVNAYFRSAERLGIHVRYDTPVEDLVIKDGRFVAALVPERVVNGKRVPAERFEAASCVLAAGGFESNRGWLREAWGTDERGGNPSDNFLIRGTRFNTGAVLRSAIDLGADIVGDPTQAHMVAVDARSPLYDGGICTRIDCVSMGIVVNRNGERFYDEGEDFWPKRYAIWGRLVAMQPDQIGYSIIDSKPLGSFMPPVFPGIQADTLEELADKLGISGNALVDTVSRFNGACQPGDYDHTVLDGCHTRELEPEKSHWARPLDKPPYHAYPLRPGITFTYLGLETDATAAVRFGGAASPNLFVAGEMMAGNILGQGYIGGVGLAIGTTFGRTAGRNAAGFAKTQRRQDKVPGNG